MISIIDDWKFTRQLGIGEKQHVRANLLGIGCFSSESLVEQIEGAFRAAETLGLLGRVHINASRETPATMARIYALCAQHPSMQLEDYIGMTEEQFAIMCPKVEIFVEPTATTTYEEVAERVDFGIRRMWEKSGERFLQGNFGYLEDDVLKVQYPQFYYDYNPYWEQFKAK